MLSEGIYHVWFGTKRRVPVLQGEIEDDVKEMMRENALHAGARLLEAETAVDHVHLVVAVPEDTTLSSVMHQIKGTTSHALFLKYPELKIDMREAGLWQKSYSFRKVEPDDVPAARSYVRTQELRSLRHE